MNTQVDTVEGELSKTELGSWFLANKKLVFGFVLFILVGFGGWGIYQKQMDLGKQDAATEIYQFIKKYKGSLPEKKLVVKDFIDDFTVLSSKLSKSSGLVEIALTYGPYLTENNNLLEAQTVYEAAMKSESGYSRFFVGIRLAGVYEDLDKTDLAISTLESLNADGLKIFDEVTYLNLGRLYLKKGDKEKAKQSLQFVMNGMAQEEFKSMAQIYLEQM